MNPDMSEVWTMGEWAAKMESVAPTKFRKGQKVTITGDVAGGVSGKLDPIPDGEVCTVFEDYGQTHINVMRDNGQLRAVARAAAVLA